MVSTANRPWVGKGVVIIDDSKGVRDELRAVFTACGMQVVGEAATGITGLELVMQHQPEVVSLDLIMPEMDGVECYRRIQAARPETKMIMITWLGGEPKILDNLKDLIPAHLFQTKPVSEADLNARLEKIYFPHLIKAAPKPGAPAEPEDSFVDLGIKVS